MKITRPISKQPLPRRAKPVFRGRIFDVYQWPVKGYDGKIRIFEKVKRPDTAVIIPVTKDGKIILCRQEQPGKGRFISMPAGRVDAGESPLDAAKRELFEETGYKASKWALFDAVQPVSKAEWSIYTFIARNCYKAGDQELDGAERIKPFLVNTDTFVKMALDDSFGDPELKIKLLRIGGFSVNIKRVKRFLKK